MIILNQYCNLHYHIQILKYEKCFINHCKRSMYLVFYELLKINIPAIILFPFY